MKNDSGSDVAAINLAGFAGTIAAAKILPVGNLADIIGFVINGDHSRSNHTRMKGLRLMLGQVGIATIDITKDKSKSKGRLAEILDHLENFHGDQTEKQEMVVRVNPRIVYSVAVV